MSREFCYNFYMVIDVMHVRMHAYFIAFLGARKWEST